jgi:hypothetical protein
VSVNAEKATTRNILDGLRSYLTTFDEQRNGVRREESRAITDSREYSLHSANFDDALPQLQHYSFVVLLTLTVEARLAVFCETLQLEHGISPGIDGLRGGLLHRARSFLTQHFELEPPEDLWRWLQDLARVRDCIIRCAGNLDLCDRTDRRHLTTIAKRRPGLEIRPDRVLFHRAPKLSLRPKQVLHIDPTFCLETVTAASGLFGYLYQHRDPTPR